VNADGLHLGAEDGSLAATRKRLGSARILGASCYDRLERALEAERLGADYVAFGSFFPSSVKPGAVRAPLALLRHAKRSLSVPVVAIGGITLDNAPQLIAAGADGVAVVSALFGADDVRLAARRFSALFARRELETRDS
jgi:thiamine-phosphate pyrophosphorylase